MRAARVQKYAQADGARARFLEGFDLAQMNERGELVAFVDDGFGVGGSGLESARDHVGGTAVQTPAPLNCKP